MKLFAENVSVSFSFTHKKRESSLRHGLKHCGFRFDRSW